MSLQRRLSRCGLYTLFPPATVLSSNSSPIAMTCENFIHNVVSHGRGGSETEIPIWLFVKQDASLGVVAHYMTKDISLCDVRTVLAQVQSLKRLWKHRILGQVRCGRSGSSGQRITGSGGQKLRKPEVRMSDSYVGTKRKFATKVLNLVIVGPIRRRASGRFHSRSRERLQMLRPCET